MMNRMIGLLGFIFTIQAHADGHQGGVSIEVNGFHSQAGKVMIALAASKEEYDNDQNTFRQTEFRINNGQVIWNITNLPPGEYAIKLYHDENDNGKLDTNFFGIPKEDIGFSNNASARFGAPAYKEVKFQVIDNLVKQTIQIKYF